MRKNNIAKALFASIGFGRGNAVPRPQNQYTDRSLRKMVERAQSEGDIIINNGDGYYRPDLSKPEEALEFHHYIGTKQSRIRAMTATIDAMQKTAVNKA